MFFRLVFVFAAAFFAGSATSYAQSASEPKSYSTRWDENGESHRAVMFPHEIDGCKLLIQGRAYIEDGHKAFTESEGKDCNCDLLIDGQESYFRAATGHSARKLTEVCKGPGIDGSQRHLRIMRESLKNVPMFSKIPNVKLASQGQ